MSQLIHSKDKGLMEKQDDSIKCNICGYHIKQSEITSAYLSGRISLTQRID
ncbi:hypothetical protein [Methanobacterium sp. SMA-27]|uniref:hypothetical protein n=1 Tax=Methanobacterium sp. SMA-27 TaxID=1495336 RepID=UPI000A6993B1|nr:hypothetical protein [Methanobacterium sp. SMA-27]